MAYLALVAAVVAEVAGTTCLRVAADGRPRWYAGVALGYVTALALLSASLAGGLPLGVAYGIWTASSVALVALVGRWLFGDALDGVVVAGLVLILGGVLLVQLGSGA